MIEDGERSRWSHPRPVEASKVIIYGTRRIVHGLQILEPGFG
jgi:hypothetical protein